MLVNETLNLLMNQIYSLVNREKINSLRCYSMNSSITVSQISLVSKVNFTRILNRLNRITTAEKYYKEYFTYQTNTINKPN